MDMNFFSDQNTSSMQQNQDTLKVGSDLKLHLPS